MVTFPLKFEVKATATDGVSHPWSAQADKLPPIPSAIPPEFMGPGTGYSPEDLFAIAVLNCLIALFKVYCEKGRVSFHEIQGRAITTIDRQPSEMSFSIVQIEIFLNVTGSSDLVKIRKLLDTAIKDCPVGQSIKSGKTFHISVT